MRTLTQSPAINIHKENKKYTQRKGEKIEKKYTRRFGSSLTQTNIKEEQPKTRQRREHIIAERGSAKNEDTVTNYPIFLSPQTILFDLPSSHASNSNYSYARLSDLSSSLYLSFLGNFLVFSPPSSFSVFNFSLYIFTEWLHAVRILKRIFSTGGFSFVCARRCANYAHLLRL